MNELSGHSTRSSTSDDLLQRGLNAAEAGCVQRGAVWPLVMACGLWSLVLGAMDVRSMPAAGPEGRETAAPAFPEADEFLADVLIEGNTTIPTSAIAKWIKTRPGRPASQQQIQEDIRGLWRTRWFMNVEQVYRRTDKGLVLIFRVLERPVVSRVEYVGNEKIKTKHLAAQTGLKVGSPFDVSANRQSARRLEQYYQEKGFVEAKVTLEKGGSEIDREVVFQIVEGPKMRVVWRRFRGNKDISSGVLKTKLATTSAVFGFLGGTFEPTTLNDDLAALKQYYHGLGYFDAEVDYELFYSTKRDRITVEYQINEGVRSKIRNIQILGNDVVSVDELRKEMKLAEGDEFNIRHLNADKAKIKNKYGELGRIFAAIEAGPRFLLEEPGQVDIVYRIDEDKPYRVRRVNVHIEGDNPHTKRSVVRDYARVHPGDLANQRMLDLSKRRIAGSQIFEGAPGEGVRIEVKPVSPENSIQQVGDFRGQSRDRPTPSPREGVSSRRERVSARPEGVSYRPARLGVPQETADWEPEPSRSLQPEPIAEPSIPGTLYRAQSVDDPFANPANPIFDNSPMGDPFGELRRTPEGQLDVDIFATEARTGRLMFGVGVNSDAGVVGSIVLSEQNFDLFNPPRSLDDIVNGRAWRGGGQRFRAEAVPGSIVSRYLVSWTDPFIFNTDYSLGVSGFFYNRFFPDWDEERTGGRITIGRQFTPEISITGAIRIEEVTIDNPDVPTPQLLVDALGSNFLSSGRFSVIHDTRDSAFLPGEGHRCELSFEQAFGDFVYSRVEGEARQYYTLYSRPDGGGRHILSVGGQLGWTDDDTPIFERFYAGGFQTFRGFEFRGVSPRELGVRVGGEWLALGSVEYMVPLVASEAVQGVLFSDVGTVENDIGFDDVRVTVGFGLRIAVPAMGPVPLAFDFGFPLQKQREDDTQVLNFYVGLTR